MSNSISVNSTNNISFSARYLRINNQEAIPQRICDAIYKSDAIDEFLKAGKPKTILGKIKDFFRKNEFLEVYYGHQNLSSYDPYAIKETVLFNLTKGKTNRQWSIIELQEGIKREFGNIAKSGENPIYKAPKETATDKIVKSIEKIKDLNFLLK